MTFAEHLQPVLNRKLPAALVAVAAMFCSPARAEDHPAPGADCPLTRLASLPITVLSDGQLGVPVTLAGKEQILSLGISDPYSYLYASYVKSEGLRVKRMPRYVGIDVGKTHADGLATVPELIVGKAEGKNVQFAEFDDAVGYGSGAVGELALDILSGFDVDLDLANSRLNLFSRDHCAGNVVYWADSYAPLPFHTDATGHPSVRMQLDGKTLTVAFDIEPKPARMAMATATRLFDLDETSPGMKPVATDASGAVKSYRYPFKQLTIEGVAIGNPQIDLIPNVSECRPAGFKTCYGASDLELGLKEVRQLHLYFAFKEKMLYVTAASPDSAKDSPSPTGAPAQLGKPK